MVRDVVPAGAAWRQPAGNTSLDDPVAMVSVRRLPGPETTARVQVLLEDMYVRLLAAYPADAVIRAAAVAEVALAVMSELPPGTSVGLEALIGELRRVDKAERLAEARWLHRLRIAVEPFAGQVRPECDADARRAGEIAILLACDAGLITAQQAAACELAAAEQASARGPSALHKLDRDPQRIALQDLLDPPPRVLVLLVHGEIGQGHDHFARIVTRQLRSASSGHWRELDVEWPPPTRPLGIRLATLLEELSRHLGVALDAPRDDPTHSDGRRRWQPALDRIVGEIHAARQPTLLRHVIGCLSGGSTGDDALVDAYVRAIWNRVSQRPGQPVVVNFDLRRAERSGFPLTLPWRHGRRDLATARAIVRILDAHHQTHGGICVALPELTSIPPYELAEWLRDHAGRDRDTAQVEALRLVATTRGGRFEQVLQRLTALHLDRHGNSR